MIAGKPAVLDPVDTKDLIVTSSLGKNAMVCTGDHHKLVLGDQEAKLIPAEGLAINVDEVPEGSRIFNGKHSDSFQVSASPAPELSISLNAAPNIASVSITSTVKNATLLIDGEKQKPSALVIGPGRFYRVLTRQT